ncbi:AMIN domain-containing protein [Thiohalocapsa marina]|uniref:N-acetylmuramoyl-L-alanine amidase AmiC n=1 Tax=Thiohalocapsa marina TaxID=424902 RepID=A0A5M8FMZ5_9GAMM|nr:N-acetylmuramoyl-L-alanine amidase [Thiohalocapsa marina]KAA6185066.1 AMIN domain-containing protein [Thiohalocapsa marina]
MKNAFATILALFTALCALPTTADLTSIHGARIWNGPDHTRVVIDTAEPVEHKIFALDGPDRLVVDIVDARLEGGLPTAHVKDLLVAGLRSGVRDGDDLRIVLDLKQPVKVKSFSLTPNETYGHRVVIDVEAKDGGPARDGVPTSATRMASVRQTQQPTYRQHRDVVVAVDAGHGGEDPGAIGAAGTYEKDITLSVARKLAARINKQRGMRAVLIRDGDYFVPLRKRIDKARQAHADLFVSIHADAFNDRRVRGSSVFTLSNGAASSEAAKWLADRENRADLIGGVSLAERNEVLAGVLLDMTQNATIEHSGVAASRVLKRLGAVGEVHQSRVQQAGFVVLKSPDIPSMLVETAFISNPDEEKRLRSAAYQNRIADSLLAGIVDYFNEYPPPGTQFAREPGPPPGGDKTSDAGLLPGRVTTLAGVGPQAPR